MKKRIVKLFSAFTSKVAEGLLRGGTGKGVVNNVTMKQSNNRLAFTLIELLIVIAVLGILVTGILVVLNPVEQTRRANDAHRTSSISQLATAITAYHTSQLLQNYTPLATGSWQSTLVTAQEIKNVITIPTPKEPSPCATNAQGNVCLTTYTIVSTNDTVVIWANLDSEAEKTRAGCGSTWPYPVIVYSSSQQKTGIGCLTTAAATTGKKVSATVNIYDIDLK